MIYRLEKLRLQFKNLVVERSKNPSRLQLSAYETQFVRLRTDDVSRSGRWKKKGSSALCSPTHSLRYSNCK